MSKEETEITLRDIHNDLTELSKWIKFASIKEIKPQLERILDTNEKKTVYQLSDGKSKLEISKVSKVSSRTVSTYWNLWNQSGLTKSQTFSGGPRQIRIFDLRDFDLVTKLANNDVGASEI